MVEEKSKVLIAANGSDTPALEASLSSLGIQFSYCEGGSLADKVRQFAPVAIIIDSSLPLDTLAVISSLKTAPATESFPIIFISRPDDAEVRLRALEAGADELLTLPLDKAELKARIKSVIKIKAYNEHLKLYSRNIETEVNKRTESLKQAFEKIRVASLDTVFRLSRAAEYKDTDTGAHIERMSHYSTAIARQMKLKEEFIENILYAAPMHDIGKIGIPDRVLQKPGKLDDAEWEIMRKHTTIGAEILKDSKVDFMKLAEQIAIAHHEKWDGTGYPNKIKGVDIPLAARIVALADVFDALTSERPYKKPMELEKSCSIIVEGRGTHFDPDVVEAFLAIKEEIAASLSWWKFMGDGEEAGDLFS
jgi:putative two-component system response regulator